MTTYTSKMSIARGIDSLSALAVKLAFTGAALFFAFRVVMVLKALA